MNMNFHNVLVLAPHTDDGELGAGGFIAKLIESGATVSYFAFSTAQESVPDHLPRDILSTEVRAATKVLGIRPENLEIFDFRVRKLDAARQDILEILVAAGRRTDFDLVLTPSTFDIHQDHETISKESVRAFKRTTILGYELIWNNLSSAMTASVHLSPAHVQCKIDAMKEYRSQAHRPYVGDTFIRSLARTRGVQAGCEYAESYEVIKWVIA